jgi:putative FmdB family regulatory protein
MVAAGAQSMPIYEYRCDACGHEHEAIRKFSDAPLTTCPACGKDALVKKVSAAGFQLKGSGWYQTDFRGGSKPTAAVPAKSDATAAGSGSGGESKSSDAAPAAASEAPAAKTESKPAPAGGTSTPT